jgi:hypothetical protein
MLAVIVISASVIGFSLSSGTINNIQNDLDGKKVNSSNNKHIWLFNQDQPLKYVILKKRSAGSNKNKNVYLNLFVETRQKPSNDSMMRAEGTIELRYSTNLTDNYLYLDGISPIDFRVLNMSIEESTLLDELNLFWEEFQIALINNYKEKISNSINYPLIGRYFPMCNDKSDLLKNYNLIFSDDVKEAIKNSILTPIPKAKGKEFSISKDEYIQTIDYNHLIEKDNFNYFFIVKRFENKFKIARIQEYLK